MNNIHIIATEAVTQGIFTEDQVQAYISEGDLPIHTFDMWSKAGFIVRKGQKARLITKLWKPAKVKNRETGREEDGWVKVKAFLFTADQVAPAKKEGN